MVYRNNTFVSSIDKVRRYIIKKTGLSSSNTTRYDALPSIEQSHDDKFKIEAPEAYQNRQLLWIALCRLAEPIAATSTTAYIYHYIRHLNGCDDGNVGYYVGLLSAAYAAAQFVTGFLWGPISDRIGRKNCILVGLLGSSLSHLIWGMSSNLKMAFIARLLGGSLNANISMYKSVIGEMEEKDQKMGFAMLAGIWTIGSIFGSFLGGHLAFPSKMIHGMDADIWCMYPALLISMVCSGLLLAAFVLATITFKEVPYTPRGTELGSFDNHSRAIKRQFDGRLSIPSTYRKSLEDINLRTPLLSSALSPLTPATPRTPYTQRSLVTSNLISPTLATIPISSKTQSLRGILLSPHFLLPWTISYIVFTLQTSSYSDLVMLFSSTPSDLGGLQLTQTTLSTLFAVSSILSAVVQFLIMYYMPSTKNTNSKQQQQIITADYIITKQTSTCNWSMYAIITAVSPIIAFLVPMIRTIHVPILGIAVIMTIQATCEAVGFSILGLLVSNLSPPHLLGRVNAILFSLGALARTIGPFALSWLFALETETSKSTVGVWAVLSFVGVIGWVVVLFGRRSC